MVPLQTLEIAVKAPHFTQSRRYFLFMHGGPSQMDTFDYKPLLKREGGKPLPFARPKLSSERSTSCNLRGVSANMGRAVHG